MGTRSLTVMVDDTEEVAVLYRQYDGYPSGHGLELASFLDGFAVTNGLSLNETRKTANGGGCLAAQIVAYFKDGPGSFYLHPAGTRKCWEEYIYTVTAKPNEAINLKVESGYEDDWKTLFEGTPYEFLVWLEKHKEEEEEE